MSDETPSAAFDPEVAVCLALPIIIAALEGLGKTWAAYGAKVLRRASATICGTPDLVGQDPAAVEELEDAASLAESLRSQCNC